MFYIGGSGFVCQIIESVTFARCTFIFALRNIALGGYLDTRRNIKHLRHNVRPDIYTVYRVLNATLKDCDFPNE